MEIGFWGTVIVLTLALSLSGILVHVRQERWTAGWWTGVVLCLVVLFSSRGAFRDLPSMPGLRSDVTVINWELVYNEVVDVQWVVLVGGLVGGVVVWEALMRLAVISAKIFAAIMLCLSFSTMYIIAHLFLIRARGYIFVSVTWGLLLSGLLWFAFLAPDGTLRRITRWTADSTKNPPEYMRATIDPHRGDRARADAHPTRRARDDDE